MDGSYSCFKGEEPRRLVRTPLGLRTGVFDRLDPVELGERECGGGGGGGSSSFVWSDPECSREWLLVLVGVSGIISTSIVAYSSSDVDASVSEMYV